jgi:hypothetical protein
MWVGLNGAVSELAKDLRIEERELDAGRCASTEWRRTP